MNHGNCIDCDRLAMFVGVLADARRICAVGGRACAKRLLRLVAGDTTSMQIMQKNLTYP